MDIGILGPLTVTMEGREIPVGARKQCALLALLVLRRNEVVPIGMLVDEIWHDHPPATAPKIVQGYVSQLRKTLGPQVVETRLGGYRFSWHRTKSTRVVSRHSWHAGGANSPPGDRNPLRVRCVRR